MKEIDKEIQIAELLNKAGLTKCNPLLFIQEEKEIMLTPYEYVVYMYMRKYWSKRGNK